MEDRLKNAQWRKSRRSAEQGHCVEIAALPHAIAIRDSTNPDGLTLTFTPGTWRTFVTDLRET